MTMSMLACSCVFGCSPTATRALGCGMIVLSCIVYGMAFSSTSPARCSSRARATSEDPRQRAGLFMLMTNGVGAVLAAPSRAS